MPLKRGLICHNITYDTAITAESKSDIRTTTDTPYLALTGELWGDYCEDLWEHWPRYNGTALYVTGSSNHPRQVIYGRIHIVGCLHIFPKRHQLHIPFTIILAIFVRYLKCVRKWRHRIFTLNTWLSMHQVLSINIMKSSSGNISVHRWIPCTKASDTELWCFLWSWINGWVNNREAGDLRRHRAHYDVIVMLYIFPKRYQLHIPFTNTLAIFVKHTMLNEVSQMFQKMMPLNIYIKHIALSARKAVDKTSSTMKASWRRNAILIVDSNHKRPVILCFFVVTLNQHLNKQPSFR